VIILEINKKRIAGLWPRFLGLLIDLILFFLIFLPITKLVKGVWIMSASDHRWSNGIFITDPLCIGFLIFMFLYFVILEGLTGYTLGKWMIKIRVVDLKGKIPGLRRGFYRNILRFIDGLPVLNILGIYLIVNSEEKARFGDRIAGTRVIFTQS
jgi:uncharacterized RDD family membrane protein YckC